MMNTMMTLLLVHSTEFPVLGDAEALDFLLFASHRVSSRCDEPLLHFDVSWRLMATFVVSCRLMATFAISLYYT